MDSPIIYYFTGLRLSQVNDVSWLTVKLTTASNTIVDYKQKLKKYKFTFTLPQRYTMKL